jgi:hypothetical protein
VVSSLGYHVLKRVPETEVDPALREMGFVRLRGILVAWAGAHGADPALTRTQAEAKVLAEELRLRVLGGEDMATLAREHDDDPGGRERAGDLGWIHRQNPNLSRHFDTAFLLRPGEVSKLMTSSAGFVILRRER